MKKDEYEQLFKLEHNKNLPNQNEVFIPIEKYRNNKNILNLNEVDKYAYYDLKKEQNTILILLQNINLLIVFYHYLMIMIKLKIMLNYELKTLFFMD